ncbi:hypothetical protein [Gelidibacter mesophilus]|uniref:hypothetical protein n=1 Tax=Gelidibacter mesophilus TaxID=169050 RepID=UPI000417755C|nr:hypothetical protein [Gelidibacter mesophilus]
MKFTRYFAGVIKNQGIPHIDVNEYRRLFNIISLEAKLEELYKLNDNERSHDRKYTLDIRIHTLKELLDRQTMENTPQNVLKYMLSESKSEY